MRRQADCKAPRFFEIGTRLLNAPFNALEEACGFLEIAQSLAPGFDVLRLTLPLPMLDPRDGGC